MVEQMELGKIDEIIDRYKYEKGAILGVLQDIQAEYNYLPEGALMRIADRLAIPLSHVCRVATFYTAFSLKPRGRHLIGVCLGTTCHVRGGEKLVEKIGRDLGIKPSETTEGGKFTMEIVRCLGCCSLAPAVRIDKDTYGRLRQAKLPKILEKYE